MRLPPAIAVLLGVLLCAGCAEDAREITVGIHRLSVDLPGGWEYLDHGLEHTLRKGSARIAIKDMGVATRSGYLREIEAARDLWREGRTDGAMERVRRLPIPRTAGFSREERDRFQALWLLLTSTSVLSDTERTEQAYQRVLEAITYLPDPELEVVVHQTLEALAESERRSIASQRRITVGGRDALEVDTWDWLSHDHRKRFVLLFNRGHLLVVWIRTGRFEDAREAYAKTVSSLRVMDPS